MYILTQLYNCMLLRTSFSALIIPLNLFWASLSLLALSIRLLILSRVSSEGSGFSCRDSLMHFLSFSKQSAKFNCWYLVSSERNTKWPSLVSFDWNFSRSFALTLSLSHLAESRWNLKSTFVFTLFTFCPPGPELRLYVICNWSKGIYPSKSGVWDVMG